MPLEEEIPPGTPVGPGPQQPNPGPLGPGFPAPGGPNPVPTE